MLALELAPVRPKADPEENHLYCCDPDVSLCGLDLSEVPESDFPDEDVCLICDALSGTCPVCVPTP